MCNEAQDFWSFLGLTKQQQSFICGIICGIILGFIIVFSRKSELRFHPYFMRLKETHHRFTLHFRFSELLRAAPRKYQLDVEIVKK